MSTRNRVTRPEPERTHPIRSWSTLFGAAEGDAGRTDVVSRSVDLAVPAGVRIEVASTRPVEVQLDLRPEAAGARLLIHALRAVDPDKPRLTDVVLEAASANEPARLRIGVRDDQPGGVYTGLLI